jgi:hypothetical protein
MATKTPYPLVGRVGYTYLADELKSAGAPRDIRQFNAVRIAVKMGRWRDRRKNSLTVHKPVSVRTRSRLAASVAFAPVSSHSVARVASEKGHE